MSASARDVLGYEPDELVGQPASVLGSDMGIDQLRGQVDGIGNRPNEVFAFETRARRRDGGIRIIEGTVVNLLSDPAVRGSVVNARDITDRREAEVARRRSETALRSIVQSSPLAIFALDRSGNVQLWNRACERVFGWSADDAIGGPP